MTSKYRMLVASGWVSVLLAGCASDLPPRYSDLAALTTAVTQRIQKDRGFRSSSEYTVTQHGRVLLATAGSAEVEIAPDGPRSHATTERDEFAGTTFGPSETVILPTAAYLGIPPEKRGADGKAYYRHDPTRTDPFSLQSTPAIELSRSIGTRIFCGSEFGRAEIVEAAPAMRDGVPVMRYTMSVDLSSDSSWPLMTDFLRGAGFTSFRSVLDVDGQDHLLGCSVHEEIPGGVLESEERTDRIGEPVEIVEPAPDAVTDVPPN